VSILAKVAIDKRPWVFILFWKSRPVADDISFTKRRKTMLYFVKENTIHKFPVPKRCTAVREKEQLRDTIPHDVVECPYCMRSWPGDKE